MTEFCIKCYEVKHHPFYCGHTICESCFMSNYTIKIKKFIKLCQKAEIDQINSYDLKVKCLECELFHPYPGEYILSYLPTAQISSLSTYKTLLILKLDGIICTIKPNQHNELEIYIQDSLIQTIQIT